MNKILKISFVIPAYNAEPTLKEAVYSILNTNLEDGDEIIIVNDASGDRTKETAEEISKSNKSVKIINNQKNLGCPASRNIGIREAKNELIFNLDSDNILAPDSIKNLREFINKEDIDIVSFGEYHYFQKDTKKITHKWICKSGLFTLADLFSGMFNPAPGGNFLYKKSIWEKVGGYWEYGKGLHEAWGFSFKLLLNGAKFLIVPGTFYFHRYSHDSLFIRENRKNNESINITNKFIEGSKYIFDDKSTMYINKNKDWLNFLDRNPLKLKGYDVGENGKIVFTSKIKQLLYNVRKILNI